MGKCKAVMDFESVKKISVKKKKIAKNEDVVKEDKKSK